MAAVAMSATLPGRTHGLSLITEPLLDELALSRTAFASINLWSSLLGAVICLPTGLLIDRYGVRIVSTLVTAVLALAVLWMSSIRDEAELLVSLTVARGFGQSALSVAAMAMIGKWFGARAGMAMGLFAVLLTIGFIAGILGLGQAVTDIGWRSAWRGLGLLIAGLVPVLWLVVRDRPASADENVETPGVPPAARFDTPASEGFTWREAIQTPAFWVILFGTAMFNFAWSGVTLFMESMVVQQGFTRPAAIEVLSILTGMGLVANLAAGALATRGRLCRILSVGLLLLAGALVAFPGLHSETALRCFALALGGSGGVLTVVFFAAWGQLFGQPALGRIQATGQLATVLASSLGPVVFAESLARTNSYRPVCVGLGIGAILLACLGWMTPTPRRG